MFQNLLGNMLGGDLDGARPFSVQLRAFSAPFFQGYDAEKVNSLNYSGKVGGFSKKIYLGCLHS